jgi:hypothetical protein
MQLRKLPVALVVSFPTLRRGEVAWVLLVGCCWLLVAGWVLLVGLLYLSAAGKIVMRFVTRSERYRRKRPPLPDSNSLIAARVAAFGMRTSKGSPF